MISRGLMGLTAVDTLSDDDAPAKLVPAAGLRPLPQRRPRRGFKKKLAAAKTLDIKKLHHTINGRCGCQSRCFQPFQMSSRLLDQWIHLRKTIFTMTKLEKDRYAGISVLGMLWRLLCGFMRSLT